jgi:hypothetical protein
VAPLDADDEERRAALNGAVAELAETAVTFTPGSVAES